MLTLANAGAVNSTINFADSAGLTTALNTAYTINDADKLVNGAVNNAAGRLTLGSVGTGASLTISDAFTYTQAGLDAIAIGFSDRRPRRPRVHRHPGYDPPLSLIHI